MEKYFTKLIDSKLMLCSRDIKVGDKLTGGISGKNFETVGENEDMNDFAPEKLGIHNDVFKVIGEISPDALGYVKEGMEYNREDIKPFYLLAGGECEYLEGHDPERWLKHSYYKIKGPCGHFH